MFKNGPPDWGAWTGQGLPQEHLWAWMRVRERWDLGAEKGEFPGIQKAALVL